ncbi:MAG: 3-phosphoshikimate 1-carboxyvinyltransferase [Candidatus Omnitrophica bacterium]|nr:3-phosphoshikimate 1-carboxyvinyltransferase [Candidatus Omnitrophota bacterium]
MKGFVVHQASGALRGKFVFPGDKSIAHRCVILSALSRKAVTITNFPTNEDCLATIQVFRQLGVRINHAISKQLLVVSGHGLHGLRKPSGPIVIKESGTTFRLLLGVLAGQPFSVTLSAGKALSRRPMARVTKPLRLMGTRIHPIRNTQDSIQEEFPPLTICGGDLHAITYKMPVASAQVKSAILLAGLYAQGITKIIEPVRTRDHTERILTLFNAEIKKRGNAIELCGGKELKAPKKIMVPGDISSAAFFIVLACIMPQAHITIKHISLNPSRTGALGVLKRMGARITATRSLSHRVSSNPEPQGDISVKSSTLKSTVVERNEIPSLIDELPILMVAAACARGKTVFEGVGELRVKETDRIRSMSDNLQKMGVKISIIKRGVREDIVVEGAKELKGARVKSFGDHRTAMSMVVAGLKAKGSTRIDDVACIGKSFPRFIELVKRLVS